MARPATSTCTEQGRSDGYAPRRPEDTLLHALVSEHWPRFRERAEAQGGLPKFVEEEFGARCGILEYGLVQLACGGCGHEVVVGFSCRRGFCPSCLGRRMSDRSVRKRPARGRVMLRRVRCRRSAARSRRGASGREARPPTSPRAGRWSGGARRSRRRQHPRRRRGGHPQAPNSSYPTAATQQQPFPEPPTW
ncbi:MAG: hypothetical protein ACI9KE_004019 [Polyangiales bacterium]